MKGHVFLAVLIAAVAALSHADSDTPGGAGTVLVMELHGPIDRFQAVYVRRTVERARSEGAALLVVDIDTFGGRVDSALQIANALGSSEVPTASWIRLRPDGTGVGWSAGALIALATERIFMAPGTSIGAAAPVIQSPGGMSDSADEKTVSAIRGQISALAERNGHSPVIARAMVDPALEAHLVLVDGEQRIVDAAELAQLERNSAAGSLDLEVVRTVSAAGSLLTLTAGEMESLGVSAGSPATREELADVLGVPVARLESLTPQQADRLVAALTGGGFTSLLILIGLVALGLEVSSPGFGVPGAVAIAAFAAVFAANMLLGQVGSVELLLFVLGVVLLVMEIFVIPGFGVAGITGLTAISAALILAMQDFAVPDYEWQWSILGRNAATVFGALAGALILAAVLATVVPHNRFFFSRLVLANTQSIDAGFTVQPREDSSRLEHRRGIVRSDLRPVGSMVLDSPDREVLTVESDGTFIPKDTVVEVVRVEGNRIVVRKA